MQAVQKEAQTLTEADVKKLRATQRDLEKDKKQEIKMANTAGAGSAPKKKAPATKKVAAPKVKKEGATERTRFNPNEDKKIELLVDGNPRRDGGVGFKNFGLYKNGMTVAKFKEIGGKMPYLRTDVEKKFVKLV
jgi:hypothetical protein